MMRIMKRRNFVIHTPEEIVRIREAAHAAALAREESRPWPGPE